MKQEKKDEYKMKIMFVIDGWGGGGAERVICNLASYLVRRHEVSIVSFGGNERYSVNEKVKLYNDVDTTIFLEEKNKIKKAFLFLRRVKKFNKCKKEIQPDIIISFLSIPNYVVLFSNMFKKVKVIISERNDPNVFYSSFRSKFLMNWLYPKTDGFVFQTEKVKQYFKKRIQEKGTVIANPINEKFIGKVYKGERKKEIVSVGRLVDQKNHKLLINVFANISKKYPDYKLIIYGEGGLRGELTKLIEDLNLKEKVVLYGNASNIEEKIYDAEMFVLPSIWEGMPNSLMEAMALGLPCIATNCPSGGPEFLIQNDVNGILIECDNGKNLEDAIKKILDDKEFAKKIGENASKIAETLNPDEIYKKWESYIEFIYNS